MPLRKRGDRGDRGGRGNRGDRGARGNRGDFEEFIDMGQMRTFLLGDPSDSDPGYEVTNLIHKVFKKAAHNIGL